jgi:spore germination cell wall hydrolase CwlJ-like protein
MLTIQRLLIALLAFVSFDTNIPHHSMSLTAQMINPNELTCLAKNLYHEARGEGIVGMTAVANVTLNRLRSNRFPKSICSVVYQTKQFSWTASEAPISELHSYKSAVEIATDMLLFGNRDITDGSLFYHSISIKRPYWTRKFTKVATVGNHVFYKP